MGNNSRNIQTLNFIGVTLAIFAFVFAPWLGSRSGLWLLFDLGNYLLNSSQVANPTRQIEIFILLVILTFLLIGQLIAVYSYITNGNSQWILAEIFLSVTAVGILSSLFFGFQAQTTGVQVTTLGCLIATGSALYIFLQQKSNEKGSGTLRIDEVVSNELLQPDKEFDPMLNFQRNAANKFNDCVRRQIPFCLSVVSIAHYESYETIFGNEEAQKLKQSLIEYLKKVSPNCEAMGFSVGAVMVALPDVAPQQMTRIIDKVTKALRNTGFAGEMLLPNGRIELVIGTASFPEDVDNLGQLIEIALTTYSEAIAKLDKEFTSSVAS